MTTRFCFVRHGETDWNAEKRIQGQRDIGLNATGEAQARAVRPGLVGQVFNAVYSSDLQRAWRTAELATEGLGYTVLPASTLRERHYGIYQGLTAEDALARHPEVHRHHAARRLDYDYETGETLIDFAARIESALAGLVTRHAGGTVLAFTHGGVLDIIYRLATGRDLAAARDFAVPNAALNWLEHGDGGWRVLAWADRRHLDASLDEVT